jgi:Holliday junction resolvase RusA-like endonuclease
MSYLKVWIDRLPPSSNKIYVSVPGKGRFLSPQASAFKVYAMRTIQQQGRVAFLGMKQNVPYELRLIVFFDQVEYLKSAKGTRYKRIDLSNQVKLIEDTVAAATGIDDSHNFRMVLEKHCDPDHPGMYVTLLPISEDRVGLTKEQYDEDT